MTKCFTVLATKTPDPWHQYGIVPKVIDVAPVNTMTVKYGKHKTVNYGNELTPAETEHQPTVSWHADKDCLYTLVMIGKINLSFTNYNNESYT